MTTMNEQCPQCGGPLVSQWPAARMFKCKNCTLVIRSPQPTDEELEAFYRQSWAEPQSGVEGTGATDSVLAELFGRKLAGETGVANFEGLRLLDHGAGRGAMLRVLAAQGAEVYAVEPFGYDQLKADGFNVVPSLDALPPDISFDGVITIDVVEHLAAPWTELQRLHQTLKPGGWLYVATPNAAGISALTKRGAWDQAQNPGHLYLFTPRSMAHMLAQAGFVSIRRLRWYIRYAHVLPKTMLHYSLQALRLDGELRYLAVKGA